MFTINDLRLRLFGFDLLSLILCWYGCFVVVFDYVCLRCLSWFDLFVLALVLFLFAASCWFVA